MKVPFVLPRSCTAKKQLKKKNVDGRETKFERIVSTIFWKVYNHRTFEGTTKDFLVSHSNLAVVL